MCTAGLMVGTFGYESYIRNHDEKKPESPTLHRSQDFIENPGAASSLCYDRESYTIRFKVNIKPAS